MAAFCAGRQAEHHQTITSTLSSEILLDKRVQPVGAFFTYAPNCIIGGEAIFYQANGNPIEKACCVDATK